MMRKMRKKLVNILIYFKSIFCLKIYFILFYFKSINYLKKLSIEPFY